MLSLHMVLSSFKSREANRHLFCFLTWRPCHAQMARTSPNTTSPWEQEWERVLWKKKSYPDNYVPSTRFLEALKTNGAVEPHQ